MSRIASITLVCLLALSLLACEGEAPPASQSEASGQVAPDESIPAGGAEADAPSSDSGSNNRSESTDRYEYRVRWSESLGSDPGLEAAVRGLADHHLQEFVQGASAATDAQRWTLELEFSPCAGTSGLRCIAGDGSIYSGGAHPLPIVERLLYSTSQARPLRPDQLFTDDGADAALRAISTYAREILLTQRIAQASASGAAADAAARASMRDEIRSGAEPSAANYRLAEPVVGDSGKINALKFVFAPYQVASYAEGTLVAEVPAGAFAQWLRPEFRDEFVTR